MYRNLSRDEEQQFRSVVPAFFELHLPIELSYDTVALSKDAEVQIGSISDKLINNDPTHQDGKQQKRDLLKFLEIYSVTPELLDRNTKRDRGRKTKVSIVSLGKPLGSTALERLVTATQSTNKELGVNTPLGTGIKRPSSATRSPFDKYLEFTQMVGPQGFLDACRQIGTHRANGRKIPEHIHLGSSTLVSATVIRTRESLIAQDLLDPKTLKPKGELLRRLIAQRDHPNTVAVRNERIPHTRSPQTR